MLFCGCSKGHRRGKRGRGSQRAWAGAGYAGRAGLHPHSWLCRPAQRSGTLTELKLACQGRVGERKLELVRGGPDLCSWL